jgi:hypothetical protein
MPSSCVSVTWPCLASSRLAAKELAQPERRSSASRGVGCAPAWAGTVPSRESGSGRSRSSGCGCGLVPSSRRMRARIADGVQRRPLRRIGWRRARAGALAVEQVQVGPQERDDVHRSPSVTSVRAPARPPAPERVAPELGLAIQPGGHGLHLLQPEQLRPQAAGVLACPARHLRVLRWPLAQQQAGAQQHDPGGHDQPAAALGQGRGQAQRRAKLVQQVRQRDPAQVDALRPRKVQQEVERSAEPVQVQARRALGGTIVLHMHPALIPAGASRAGCGAVQVRAWRGGPRRHASTPGPWRKVEL